MPARKVHVPKYCLHKPSGRAYVRIGGKVVYLGVYDSPESKKAYARQIAELAAQPSVAAAKPAAFGGITVIEVIADFLDFAEGYYGKDGKPTSHVYTIRAAMRILKELYGDTAAEEFGPLAFRAIQQKLVDQGGSRSTINKLGSIIKLCFKWAVSHELVPPKVHQGLLTVPGLKYGRTEARETEPILPVDDELVNATLPHMSPIVADMVRFQRLVGCRPSEVCRIRPCDVSREGDVWEYRPETHKTQYRGRDRVVYVGPKAQAILAPYLDRDSEAGCFSPAESEALRRKEQRDKRKTKIQPSQRNRRKAKPKRQPRTAYDKNSYNRAITRAIEKANEVRTEEAVDMGIEPILLDHWYANQLRHSRATEVRHKFGLEGAQVILGHSRADVTEVYAERDAGLAAEISRKSG